MAAIPKTRTAYGVYILAYLLAFGGDRLGLPWAAALLLGAAALFLYVSFARQGGSLVDLKALFSLAWVGGEALACLKLSRLQSAWEPLSWLCFFVAYLAFCLAYDWAQKGRSNPRLSLQGAEGRLAPTAREYGEEAEGAGEWIKKDEGIARRILFCILALALCSLLCLGIEIGVEGYLPILSDKPHAYSYFHVSGVHYFTISCILIPGLTLLYLKAKAGRNRRQILALVFGNVTAVAIPILVVSRFQLLFAVGFAAVLYLLLYRQISWRWLLLGAVAVVALYGMLTVFRNHDVAYLNGIFEMKNEGTPIFITQPYMYIANNYENFNCLVRDLPAHTWGLRMLFPVIALTGLKFLYPQLAAFPLYTTKEELTTLTLFYDGYYDFGLLGVLALGLVLGFAAGWMSRWCGKAKNPVFYLFYGQMAIYLGLSFFTTWFSNPTTWFWLALTGVFYLYVGWKPKGREA